MSDGRRRKVARNLKYSTGRIDELVRRYDLSDVAELYDREWGDDQDPGDDGDDGRGGVREPRRPLPPEPIGGGGERPLPKPIITVRLPNPPVP